MNASPAELHDSPSVVRYEGTVHHKGDLRDVGLVETPVRAVNIQSLCFVVGDIRADHFHWLVAVPQVMFPTLRQVPEANIVLSDKKDYLVENMSNNGHLQMY